MRSTVPPATGKRSWPAWTAPALIAAIAFVAVTAAIDPAGDYPGAPQGPGLTVDEMFNVQQGVRLVEGLRVWSLGLISGQHDISLREIFGDERDLGPNAPFGYYLADHPPLGRFWLGLWHSVAVAAAPPRDHPSPYITACARVGSAAAFALTVFLCGWAASKWYGVIAGIFTAVALAMMPRVFGHAHLAALETCTGLAYLAAVLAAARWANSSDPPSWKWAALAGVAMGAALATKIQGVLIPIPVAIWAAGHWRTRAIRPLAIWAAVGFCSFFLFFPWLWFDPIHRLAEYFQRSTERTVLYVWYFGQRYLDREAPWHYAAVLFLATVPIGLQALGGIGVFAGPTPAWKERRGQLLLAAVIFPLLLFSMPGVARYDGVRLFLVVFPVWAIFIGRGGATVWSWLRTKTSRSVAALIAALFLTGQAWGIVAVWPCFLSYYNLSMGGLAGADRAGQEIDYWGEGVTRDLLEELTRAVPEGAHVAVCPVLHQFQLEEMQSQSPILRARKVVLLPYRGNQPGQPEYLLMFRRLADLPPELRTSPGRPLAEVRRGGVLLAGLYDRRAR
jgi:Dolichyl-phosphate-mannose-protein mannosyltransferase